MGERAGAWMSDDDLYLFGEGTYAGAGAMLGAHPVGEGRWRFAVWAPNARRVDLLCERNYWGWGAWPLAPTGSSGIWVGTFEGIGHGDAYKFGIEGGDGARYEKADPYARFSEEPPRTASIAWESSYRWRDEAWMRARKEQAGVARPISIYELHAGSWRRAADGSFLGWRALAEELAPYLRERAFTHVELMPISEHPFYGSWGYQTTGYFAPTARYGTPDDFRAFVDLMHAAGLGVLLDWVPSHFPNDAHGLWRFDGTHLYEHADPRQGFHPDWKSAIFNYDRAEVRSFLISSALFWLDEFHLDGLRVDAVASMLYLDYSRAEGEWVPNVYGGRENLGAIALLRRLNELAYARHPGAHLIAEESTAWPGVSRPTWAGGLGFGMKWDMGWMHDSLGYLERDPIHRAYHHNELTFRSIYMHSERYVLALSHDEVVHGKGSLLAKMPGDRWRQLANLRLLFAWMHAQPGKKLLFMGCEWGASAEWDHDAALDWAEASRPEHAGVDRLVADLNRAHAAEPALYEVDFEPEGFEWIEGGDAARSILSFVRWDAARRLPIVCVFNFTPVPRHGERIGVPAPGAWREFINTDAEAYGGSGVGNFGGVRAEPIAWHGRAHSIEVSLPPLGALFFVGEGLDTSPLERRRRG